MKGKEMDVRIILASASPRRRELLAQAGIPFEIIVGDTKERITKEQPWEIVEELSHIKAEGVAAMLEGDAVVIGADTIVAMDGEVLGKPADVQDAARMLRMLQGRRHQVYTGVTLIRLRDKEQEIKTFHECTDVFMASMDEREIADYIATGEPMDKAGAYGIQGRAGVYIERIEGDYYNVVGLPISRLYRELKEWAQGGAGGMYEEQDSCRRG